MNSPDPQRVPSADDLAEALVAAWNAARRRDPALPVLTEALRTAGWLPLTEVEEALRDKANWWHDVPQYRDGLTAAADLVASLAQREGLPPDYCDKCGSAHPNPKCLHPDPAASLGRRE